MNKLYVPEIGDEITLSDKWSFTLYPERRNEKLGKLLGLYKEVHHPAEVFKREVFVEDVQQIFCFQYKSQGHWEKKQYPREAYNSIEWVNLDGTPFIGQRQDYKDGSWTWKLTYPVTMEASTSLKIDRIYIRKGGAEYSSLTFWVKSGPYKGARFWAKLSDVNTICFQ